MTDSDVCVCGHARNDHGHDLKFPGSTACRFGFDFVAKGEADICDCIAFEPDENG